MKLEDPELTDELFQRMVVACNFQAGGDRRSGRIEAYGELILSLVEDKPDHAWRASGPSWRARPCGCHKHAVALLQAARYHAQKKDCHTGPADMPMRIVRTRPLVGHTSVGLRGLIAALEERSAAVTRFTRATTRM